MSSSPPALSAARVHGAIERLCASGLDGQKLLHALADRIREAVPCDGLLFLRTDPTTGLPTDGVVSALPPARCRQFWDNELLDDDYNKFSRLARGEQTAATLSAATGGQLSRSRRYETIYRPLGLGDELRATFIARDGSCWAIAAFVRAEGTTFTDQERALLAGLSPVVAEGLRDGFAAEVTGQAPHSGPAVVVLDEAGEVAAVTPEAEHWLAEIVRGSSTGMSPVPEPVYLVGRRARAARTSHGDERPWMRARTADGTWLHLHATCLEGAALGDAVAVVITPARAPDLAPLIALAYRLTGREQEVLQFLARGLTTDEIADRLAISPHTVRDHIKALLSKVGAHSRAELVARLFADHYFERLSVEGHPDPDRADRQRAAAVADGGAKNSA